MQAFWIATIFAAISLFSEFPSSPSELALKAVGFQMAVEVARHFQSAIRWTFVLELDMVSAQRLIKYATLESEEYQHARKEFKRVGGGLEFKNVTMRY